MGTLHRMLPITHMYHRRLFGKVPEGASLLAPGNKTVEQTNYLENRRSSEITTSDYLNIFPVNFT